MLCGPSLGLGWLLGVFQRRTGRKEEQILFSADSYPCSLPDCVLQCEECLLLSMCFPSLSNPRWPQSQCAQELLAAEFGFLPPIVLKESKKMCLCLCK